MRPYPRHGKGRELAIVDVSKATSVISEDVIDTMTRLGMLKYADGEHRIVATPVRDAARLAAAVLLLSLLLLLLLFLLLFCFCPFRTLPDRYTAIPYHPIP